MALAVTGNRVFKYKDKDKIIDLPDPNPTMSPEAIMEFYSNHYPDLLNGTVTGPSLGDNDEIIYNLSFTPKQKG